MFGSSLLVAGFLSWLLLRPLNMPEWLSPPVAFFLGSEVVVELWRNCTIVVSENTVKLRRFFREHTISVESIDIVRTAGNELTIATTGGDVFTLKTKWYRRREDVLRAIEEALRRS